MTEDELADLYNAWVDFTFWLIDFVNGPDPADPPMEEWLMRTWAAA